MSVSTPTGHPPLTRVGYPFKTTTVRCKGFERFCVRISGDTKVLPSTRAVDHEIETANYTSSTAWLDRQCSSLTPVLTAFRRTYWRVWHRARRLSDGELEIMGDRDDV